MNWGMWHMVRGSLMYTRKVLFPAASTMSTLCLFRSFSPSISIFSCIKQTQQLETGWQRAPGYSSQPPEAGSWGHSSSASKLQLSVETSAYSIGPSKQLTYTK